MGNQCMGNQCMDYSCFSPFDHEVNSSLIVTSLNYGGILNSPFQFYSDNQRQQSALSKIFVALLPIYIKGYDPKKFTWNTGKIDSKLQSQRYAVIYNPNVGVNSQTNKLMNSQSFRKKWDECFAKGKKLKKIQPQPTQIQIKNMRRFDQMCYHAILAKLYHQIDIRVKLKRISPNIFNKLNPRKYQKYMKIKHECAYLDEEKKIQKIKHSLMKKKADVIFIQQPTDLLIKSFLDDNDLIVRQKGRQQALVAIRKKSFLHNQNDRQPYVHDLKYGKLTQDQFYSFEGNKDVVSIVVDNFIFVSVHLTSKTQRNPKEVMALKEMLKQLNQLHPTYHIIIGADSNSFVDLSQQEDLDGYNIFPQSSNSITTNKKRTYIQCQFNKAGQKIQQCKDHIISTLKFKKKHIMTIDNHMINLQKSTINDNSKKQQKYLLPTDKHPFDHFMIVCEVQRNNIRFDSKIKLRIQ